MPRILLYPFRYRSHATGKWVKARYVAELREIEARHARGEWEIAGPPEVRDVDLDSRYFSPHRAPSPTEPARSEPKPEPQLNPLCEQPPAIDELERFLVALFLRRYVTYCARRQHFARMQGAATLLHQVADGVRLKGEAAAMESTCARRLRSTRAPP